MTFTIAKIEFTQPVCKLESICISKSSSTTLANIVTPDGFTDCIDVDTGSNTTFTDIKISKTNEGQPDPKKYEFYIIGKFDNGTRLVYMNGQSKLTLNLTTTCHATPTVTVSDTTPIKLVLDRNTDPASNTH